MRMSKKLICEKKKYVPAATSDGMTNILETAYKIPIMSPSDMKYSGFAAKAYPDSKHIAPNREISTDAFFLYVGFLLLKVVQLFSYG